MSTPNGSFSRAYADSIHHPNRECRIYEPAGDVFITLSFPHRVRTYRLQGRLLLAHTNYFHKHFTDIFGSINRYIRMEPTGYHHFHLRDLESEHGTPLLRLELCRPNPVPPPITSVNAVEADKQIQAYDDLFDSIVHRGYIVAHDATFQRIQRLVELTTVFGAFQAVTCTVSLYLQKWFTCSEKSDIGRLVSVLNMAMLFRSRVFFREAFIHLVGIWDERYNTNELDLKGEVRALISRKALLLQNQCLDVSLTLNRIIMNKESLTESQYQQIIEALESFGYNWNEVTYYKELSRINFSSLLDRELGYQCQELAKNNLFFCDPQAQLRGHLVCTILEDEEFPVGLRPSEDSW